MSETKIRNEQITSETATDGHVLTAGGTGTADWEAQAAGAGGSLLIYDDSVFQVTGSAISFDDGLEVVSTGTTAFVSYEDIGARVYNDSDITVTGGIWQILTFDSERWDTNNIHSTGSSTSRLTCQTDGVYQIHGQVYWTNHASVGRGLRIYLNGTTVIGDHYYENGGTVIMEVSTVYRLSIGDYVELQALQGTGGNLNIISSDNFSPEFMMQRIG